MAFIVKADPKDRTKTVRVDVPDEHLAQDTAEQHAQRRAMPRALNLAERVAALEIAVAALIKQET